MDCLAGSAFMKTSAIAMLAASNPVPMVFVDLATPRPEPVFLLGGSI
jgi:hypothetical protein